MKRCHCSRRLTFASGSSSQRLRLKHLNISCNYVEEADIHEAENLESFEYEGNDLAEILGGRQVKRMFYSPRWLGVAEDALGGRFASKFPQLETFFLEIGWVQIPSVGKVFSNLKHFILNVNCAHPENLWELIYTILKAAPSLHKLELHFPYPREDDRKIKEISYAGGFEHSNLREVEMYNFGGDAKEVELLMYLTRWAPAIQNVGIHRRTSTYLGDGKWCKSCKKGINGTKRKRVFRLLCPRLPPSINLQVS